MASGTTIRHVLVTGPPGVGKTTIVNRACEGLSKLGIPTQGFYTEEVREHGQRTGFDVVTLNGDRGPLASIKTDGQAQGRQYTVGKYNVRLTSFENTAIPSLISKSDKRSVIVIDEIGKMELFSQSFIRTVKDILDKPGTTVLATIPIAKGRPIPFVEEVRNRKDSCLFTVSRENRNVILDDIVEAVKQSFKSNG